MGPIVGGSMFHKVYTQHFIRSAFGLSLLLIALSSSAGWKEAKPQDFQVEDPPIEGSVQDEEDHKQLLKYQQERTDAQCDLAQKQWVPSFDVFFKNSGILDKSEASQAKALVSQVMGFTEKVSSYYKKLFKKERPYDRFSDVHPCITKPAGNKSYPSFHAAAGAVGACVLAEIYPAKAQALESYGNLVGELRVIAGVHHPTDVVTGQKLAKDICEYLKGQPDFISELEKIQNP